MKQLPQASKQQGMAMLVSLIMLLLMTMIIIHGARSSTLEVFIANNVQNVAQALMRAEDSTLTGETFIQFNYIGAPTTNFSQDETDGLYTDLDIDVSSLQWEDYETEIYGADETLREFIVEYVGPVAALRGTLSIGAGPASDKRFLYRVSGRGESARGSARVVQTIYATAE
jgi:type IV pilus assembly protein PilX